MRVEVSFSFLAVVPGLELVVLVDWLLELVVLDIEDMLFLDLVLMLIAFFPKISLQGNTGTLLGSQPGRNPRPEFGPL